MTRARPRLAGFVAGAGLLCAVGAHAAALTASVDRNAIEDGDIVQLTLELDGQSAERPDTTPLAQDFEVLGSSNMTQMNVVNGRATTSTRWIFNLRPKRVGLLTIPSLRIGAARSQAIPIRVAASRQGQGKNPDLFLETEVDPRSPYVQAQLRLTVRLYHAVALQSGQLSEPRNADVLIHRAGEDRHYAVTRNGRRYKVIERRYALFAQQSGKLTIDAPVFEGQVIDAGGRGQSLGGRLFGNDPFFGRDPFNGLIGATRPVRVRGRPLEILVQARPPAAQGRDWVPARSVELSGQWQPEQRDMKVGEPVTLTLDVQVEGLTGAQLPEIVADKLDGFSVYPDRAEVTTQFGADGHARGKRTQKIAFIPRQPGEVVIPDIVLRWWNTQTDREEIARLPGITRQVQGNPPSVDGAPGAQRPSVAADAPPLAQAPLARDAARADRTKAWMGLSALLAVVWLATLVLWMRDRRVRHQPRPARADTGETPGRSASSARATIARACADNDAAGTRRALLAWGEAHWPENAPRGLEQLARRLDDEQLRQALVTLDRALYAQAAPWDGSQLNALLERLPKARPKARRPSPSVLPSHYAHTHAR